jgi:Leucine-rich repeat (LRR) protein
MNSITELFARRLNRPLADRVRHDAQHYSRLCNEHTLALSSSGAAPMSRRTSESSDGDGSAANAACSDVAGAAASAAAAQDLELRMETLLATLDPSSVLEILRAVPQPMSLLLRSLPASVHPLVVESRVTADASLDLSFQLISASSDAADGRGTSVAGSTPLAATASLPNTPDSLTIPALNPLSLRPTEAPAPAAVTESTFLPPSRPWEVTEPTAAASTAAPTVFKRAKLAARPQSVVPAPVEAIAPLIAPLTRLRSLDLSHNRLTDSAAAYVAPVIASLPHLIALNITDNELGERGLYAFGRSAPGLLSLDAGFNKIYDRDSLGPALARNLALQHLSLAGNILSGSCGMLRSYLKLLTHLTSLDLAETGLMLDDLRSLAPTIAEMTCLVSLKLSRNRIAGCKGDLKEVVSHLHALQHLDLSGMCIGERVAEDIRDCFSDFTALESLDLRGNGIQAESYLAQLPARLAGMVLLT